MDAFGSWANDDYESLSWRDVHIYGFHLDAFSYKNGTADLILDIDYASFFRNSLTIQAQKTHYLTNAYI